MHMKDETNEILSGMLADWHRWSKLCCIGDAPRTSAMFHDVRSSRQWDSESDVLDGTLHNSQMEAFDAHVNELDAISRTALAIQARNLVTGKSVWTSARLPDDIAMRAVILRDARNNLTKRLQIAGIL
jgi:hypothetical protein